MPAKGKGKGDGKKPAPKKPAPKPAKPAPKKPAPGTTRESEEE
jgi:hypothetical protein